VRTAHGVCFSEHTERGRMRRMTLALSFFSNTAEERIKALD